MPSQTPQFAPRKPRKGKSKKSARAAPPVPSALDLSSPAPPPPPVPPADGPPPRNVFPKYPFSSLSSSTPLPPPSMPKQRFLRRFLPLILTANLAVGGYVLLSTPKKQLSDKDGDVVAEISSLPVESVEATNS